MSATVVGIEMVEAMLGQLGVYQHAAAKRTELAESLVEQRFNTEHLRALLGKFSGRPDSGGIVLKCLTGPWRTELDGWAASERAKSAKAKKAKQTPEERAQGEREAFEAKAKANGREPEQQRRHELRGAMWERINYGRRLPNELAAEFGLTEHQVIDELRALQAEEPLRDLDALLASVCAFRELKGWPGKKAAETVRALVGAASVSETSSPRSLTVQQTPNPQR